ncbi:MAG: hypothetical protein IKM21_05940 [Oscillospiraceae bacterium]|nr:hypothetical protein [Oscillospiraceae bacterium]
MEGLSSWIAGISAVALIVSVISVVAPKNSAGRVVTMLGSILVLVAFVLPVLDFEALRLIGVGEAYEEKISEQIEKAEKETDEIKNNIIKEKLTAYVLDKAKTDENECKVDIKIQDGAAMSAIVECGERNISERVSEILEKELGIAKESVKIKNEE